MLALVYYNLQGGPKKIGNIEYEYGFVILPVSKARDIIKESFGKFIQCRSEKWPIQSILSWFQMYNLRKFKSKVVMIIVVLIM